MEGGKKSVGGRLVRGCFSDVERFGVAVISWRVVGSVVVLDVEFSDLFLDWGRLGRGVIKGLGLSRWERWCFGRDG